MKKSFKIFLACIVAAMAFTSCSEDVVIGDVTTAKYNTGNKGSIPDPITPDERGDATKMVDDGTGKMVPGMKIFSCMEVNDCNPLNNLCFTLKGGEDGTGVNAGKPLVDAVIFFSSNINYDSETGRVYVYQNENCQALLDQRAKYIKPLHEAGIKVIMSVLGNHDRSGVANLDSMSCVQFAQECKAICDAYDLDGVMLDDEYSSYETPVPAGFVSPSTAAMSRLYYELKKAMPDRWTVNYAYSRGYSLEAVNGHECSEYLDWSLADYGATISPSSYPGFTDNTRLATRSSEYSQGRFYTSQSYLESMRNDGYGAYMFFAMNPLNSNVESQISSMQNIAKYLFDDELVVDRNFYSKDW